MKVVDGQTWKRPAREEPTTRAGLYENEEKIGWKKEVLENYNAQGDLGILL